MALIKCHRRLAQFTTFVGRALLKFRVSWRPTGESLQDSIKSVRHLADRVILQILPIMAVGPYMFSTTLESAYDRQRGHHHEE